MILRGFYIRRLQRKKSKHFIKFLDLYLELYAELPGVEVYFSSARMHKDTKLVLGSAETPGNKICLYTKNLEKMFDCRLARVVTHEVAHLKGLDEKSAVKAEPKEPEYYDK